MKWCTHTERIYKQVSTILTNATVMVKEGSEGEKRLRLSTRCWFHLVREETHAWIIFRFLHPTVLCGAMLIYAPPDNSSWAACPQPCLSLSSLTWSPVSLWVLVLLPELCEHHTYFEYRPQCFFGTHVLLLYSVDAASSDALPLATFTLSKFLWNKVCAITFSIYLLMTSGPVLRV